MTLVSKKSCKIKTSQPILSLTRLPYESFHSKRKRAQPIFMLSEWAQSIMMLMMIATAGLYGWRMKQH